MSPIERVRCALAMADAGYATSVNLEEAEALLKAFDAQSKLLAEARETLEPFANKADLPLEWVWTSGADKFYRCTVKESDLIRATTVLAKIKAASGEGW